VANHLHQFYRQTGQAEKIRELYARLDRFEKTMTESRAERSNVTAKDTFLPHDLSVEQLNAVRDIIATETDILHVDLAQKELKYLINQRLYVLSIHVRLSWNFLTNEERQHDVIARITKRVQVPGRILIIAPNGSFRALGRKIRAVPGAAIFKR
jgi:hypothetical protein